MQKDLRSMPSMPPPLPASQWPGHAYRIPLEEIALGTSNKHRVQATKDFLLHHLFPHQDMGTESLSSEHSPLPPPNPEALSLS